MRSMDIEKLLQWAYLDELCKGGDTSTTQWDLVLLMGARRERIDDHLPAYFGEAHRDAIALHRAVQRMSPPAPALILKHAILQTRPDWLPGPIRVKPILVVGTSRPHIVGVCKGKNYYTTGSYCPLRWVPTPEEVEAARSDWIWWWESLLILARSVKLSEHVATGPKAPWMPWIDPGQAPSRVLQSQRAGR